MATKKLETLEEVKNWVSSMNAKDSKFIYRGQGNSSWKLSSTFYRNEKMKNLKQISNEEKFYYTVKFFKDNVEYLEKEMNIEENKKLSLLAEMQHFNKSTPLIDFTENIFVALWFAASYSPEKEFSKNRYLKIFFVQCENTEFNSELLFENIKFNEKNYFKLKTNDKFKRSISQQSVFLWDNISNKSKLIKSVEINGKLNLEILKWISYKGTDFLSIFPDKEGIYERFKSVSDISLNFQGVKLIFQKENEKAMEKFEKAIILNPKNEVAYNNLGNILKELGEYKEAIKKYEIAIQLNSKYPEPYEGWGVSLSKMGKDLEAIKKYKKASKIKPRSHSIFFNWGLSLQKLGNHKEACKKYEEAIKLNSKYDKAYSYWGEALAKLNEHEEACKKYEESIKINPKNHETFIYWGNSLIVLKRYEEAIQKYEEAIKINPKNDTSHNGLGISLASLKRYEESIIQFKKATEINPNNDMAYMNWGISLVNISIQNKDNQKLEEAIQKYEKAIEINPQNENAKANLKQAIDILIKNNK